MTKLMKRNDIEEMFFQPTTHTEVHSVKITPSIARLLLDNTNSNVQRKLKRKHVLNLINDMKDGHFVQNNGDSIRQDREGNIIDGQHRLNACIEANFTLKTIFVKGLETEVIKTIDMTQQPRTLADILEINHRKNYKYSTYISSVAKFINSFNSGIYGSGQEQGVNSRLNSQTFLSWIQNNPNFIDFISETMRLRANGDKLITASIFCGLKWILDKYNKLESDKFFQMLSDGIGLNSTSPIFMLRKRIMTSKFGRNIHQNKITQSELIFTIIKTWNYYLGGKTTSIMHLAKKMPKIKTIKKLEF